MVSQILNHLVRPGARASIIVESCFGNTMSIAESIAEGLTESGVDAQVVEAASAAPDADRADLIVVAAPTHNWSLPTASSRAQAARQGGHAPVAGVREWIASSTPDPGSLIVTVDTVLPGRLSGSAAKAAVQLARVRGWRAERGPSFLVHGQRLDAGERERARESGRAWVGAAAPPPIPA